LLADEYYCLFNDAVGMPDLLCYTISDLYTFVAFFQANFVPVINRNIMHVAADTVLAF
jgi:hypothetical protein